MKFNIGNHTAEVDDMDAAKLEGISWHIAGSSHHKTILGYVNTGGRKRKVSLARWILGTEGSTLYVDHIDRNIFNNTRANLRMVTASENNINRNFGPLQGVSLHKTTKRWRAWISINKKQTHLGLFDTLEEALECRKEAEQIYYKGIKK